MKSARQRSLILAGVCLVLFCSASEMDAVAAVDAVSGHPTDSRAQGADEANLAEMKLIAAGQDPVAHVPQRSWQEVIYSASR